MILRYPGGKSRGQICATILNIVSSNCSGTFAELFFGGGGITIRGLQNGLFEKILINEFDASLSDLWNQVIHEPKALCKRIAAFNPSVRSFVRRKKLILGGGGNGFDALVVNRLSHGGRGVMAGPQGGHDQSGQYKIGCRWNPRTLCDKVRKCHELFSSVKVVGNKCHSKSYEHFLGKANFYYLDPPYWEVGEGLYRLGFGLEDHQMLRQCLEGEKFPWLLSYNNHPQVLELYQGCDIVVSSTAGNGGQKPNSEILIYGNFSQ